LQELRKVGNLDFHKDAAGGTMSGSFGDFLRNLRQERGLTLRQVEREARVSNAYLSQIERGERGIPNMRVLERLAKAYGVSVTVLAEVAEKQTKGESVLKKSLEPDTEFVSRGYEKLSKENRQHLSEFLSYLLNKEQKRSGRQDE
jgi:transcriptional regulator with XRE-family HTH domain